MERVPLQVAARVFLLYLSLSLCLSVSSVAVSGMTGCGCRSRGKAGTVSIQRFPAPSHSEPKYVSHFPPRSCFALSLVGVHLSHGTPEGASGGIFFNDHLSKIKLNTEPVDFKSMNLSYLAKALHRTFSNGVISSTPILQRIALSLSSSYSFRMRGTSVSKRNSAKQNNGWCLSLAISTRT
jgi:hypothetical protein